MSTRFQSAEMRGFWTGILLAAVTDYIAIFLIALIWNDFIGALGVALVCLVVLYIAQGLWGLFQFGRYFAFFWFFERERRVVATVQQLHTLKMPRPDGLYVDADEYLLSAARHPKTPIDARIFASATLGGLETSRKFGPRSIALATSIVLEESLRRYGARGLRNLPNRDDDDLELDLDLDLDDDSNDLPRRP